MKDLKIDVMNIENEKGQIKLSDRIKDLNLGNDYIIHLKNKFLEDVVSVESWDPIQSLNIEENPGNLTDKIEDYMMLPNENYELLKDAKFNREAA